MNPFLYLLVIKELIVKKIFLKISKKYLAVSKK
jgi:hypothetical protein